jgi:hypothetical protein
MTPAVSPPTKLASIPKEVVKLAIDQGKVLSKEGKTKVEVATAMFQKLKGADRETVVAAFIEGAGLTEKGAVTYFYNCRRKASKPVPKS